MFGVRFRPRKRSSSSATLIIRGTLASTPEARLDGTVHLNIHTLSSVQFASSSGYGCMAVPCFRGGGGGGIWLKMLSGDV